MAGRSWLAEGDQPGQGGQGGGDGFPVRGREAAGQLRDPGHALGPATVDDRGPRRGGEMTMTTMLAEAGGGTDVTVVHEHIPDSIPAADNETGTRMALDHLARLVEGYAPGG
jgi:hypothetical protein